MSDTPTLYWNLASQPARAVKTLLDIGKIKTNLVTIDILKGESRSKEYLAKNPLGQIPFYTHQNVKIGESSAIMIYLCEKYSTIPSYYYGTTPQQKAIVNQYLSWYQNTFRPALFKIILIKVYGGFKNKKPFLQSQIDNATKQMFEIVNRLNTYLGLSTGPFLCGKNPTIADLLIFYQLTNFVYYGQSYEKFENVTKWFKQIYSIPEVKAIIHQWHPLAQKFAEFMRQIKPTIQSSL